MDRSGIEPPAPASAARVLVVEDDRDIRELLSEFLALEGYAVATAVNGCDALDTLAALRPDVILLDMLMPEMDGWTFAANYRAARPGPHAPIVVTAATDAAGRAAQIGAAGHCGKPFDLERLLDVIERVRAGGG